jgi:hypothetical protein
MYRGTEQDNSSVPNQEPVLAGVSDGTPLLVSMSYVLLFRQGAKQKCPDAHYYFIGECPRIRDFFYMDPDPQIRTYTPGVRIRIVYFSQVFLLFYLLKVNLQQSFNMKVIKKSQNCSNQGYS